MKYGDDEKHCSLCSSIISDAWLHFLYFCNAVKSDKIPVPLARTREHLSHYESNSDLYMSELLRSGWIGIIEALGSGVAIILFLFRSICFCPLACVSRVSRPAPASAREYYLFFVAVDSHLSL